MLSETLILLFVAARHQQVVEIQVIGLLLSVPDSAPHGVKIETAEQGIPLRG